MVTKNIVAIVFCFDYFFSIYFFKCKGEEQRAKWYNIFKKLVLFIYKNSPFKCKSIQQRMNIFCIIIIMLFFYPGMIDGHVEVYIW